MLTVINVHKWYFVIEALQKKMKYITYKNESKFKM